MKKKRSYETLERCAHIKSAIISAIIVVAIIVICLILGERISNFWTPIYNHAVESTTEASVVEER